MRSDLTKIDGVDAKSIETDHRAKTASFKVKKGSSYETKLAEAAKTNEHLAEYEIVN